MIEKLIEQQKTIKAMQENEESAIKIMKMYEDYKLRVEKAIEYIEKYVVDEYDYNGLRYINDEKRHVLEILKGSD